MTRFFRGILLCVVVAPWTAATLAQRYERGSLLFDDVPGIAPGTARSIEGYLSAREATVLGWSPQGQLLVATRFGDTTQLHFVERAGGARRQLTFERQAVEGGAFCTDP